MDNFSITVDEIRPYCEGFNAAQLEQAVQICKEYRLTPVKRQIHIQKRWTKNGDVISPLVTIDGLRGIAERSGKYEGQDGAFWCGEDGKWVDVWLSKKPPLAARVGVHKTGFRNALYAVAKFDEYQQLNKEGKATGLWVKMPDLMLAKCAEALALRRAFPDELGGLYTREEMAQADNPSSQVRGAKTQDDVTAAQSFDMGGDDIPKSPFVDSTERKAWMVSAKEALDEVDDEDQLDEWVKKFGGNIQHLGMSQGKAMNELVAVKKAEIGNRAMDAAQRMMGG